MEKVRGRPATEYAVKLVQKESGVGCKESFASKARRHEEEFQVSDKRRRWHRASMLDFDTNYLARPTAAPTRPPLRGGSLSL